LSELLLLLLFYGFLLDKFGMLSRCAGFSATAELSCYLLELTLKMQVSNTMNTIGISSNALLGNSANNFLEPFS